MHGLSFHFRCDTACAAFFVALMLVGGPPAVAADVSATYGQPNPGARSMGLGGAFVAQADDATAAFANPAGLVQLLRPEISGEFRLWFTNDAWEENDWEVNDVSTVGFISGVYPLGNWSFALYRTQLAKYEIDNEVEQNEVDPWSLTSFEIVSWGLSAAYRVTEELSFGLGLAHNQGDLVSDSGTGSDKRSSSAWSATAGALWHLDPRLSLGAFYRQGPDLDFRSANAPATKAATSPLAVPDVYGAGLSFRSAGGGLILSAEWDRVLYSEVDDDLGSGVHVVLDDADELHLGAEYAFLVSEPIIAVRAGAWLEPAHSWVVEQGSFRAADDDQIHYAAGMGFAWHNFKLDFAADYADTAVTTSVSGIYSF